MNEATRLQYLAAMGIDVFQPTSATTSSPAEIEVVATDASAPTAPVAPVSSAVPAQAAGDPPAAASHPPTRSAPTVDQALSVDQAPTADDDTAWLGLSQAVARCTRCRLHETRTQPVFGVGARHARLMIIGEAPGAEEDRTGEPFVGRAGQLLNAMLQAIGLGRDEVFIANTIKCRPPNNRDPRADEVAACTDYLSQQIDLVAPSVVLAVGRVAAQRLLQVELPLGRMRGRDHELPERGTPLVVTYHPAYLLRTPAQKARAWEDLKRVQALLSRS